MRSEKKKLILRVMLLLILGGILLGIEYFSKQDWLKEWMGEENSIENSSSKVRISSVAIENATVQDIFSVKLLSKKAIPFGVAASHPDYLALNLKTKYFSKYRLV
ncbi:hypothetical protein EMN47_01875 [Prolixibacteraceae bacterium JC049]|nr:hypothetical protein [Prolixibacteraceae bacterium JC049]